MSEAERDIPKLAAQIYQAKKEANLSEAEINLIRHLVKHGFLRPSSNGFTGTMTRKAMLTNEMYELVVTGDVSKGPVPIELKKIPGSRPRGPRFG